LSLCDFSSSLGILAAGFVSKERCVIKTMKASTNGVSYNDTFISDAVAKVNIKTKTSGENS
jgi:hypothetical protein